MPNYTILVVDDEKNILSTIKTALRSGDYEVIVTDDPHQGLSLYETRQIDLAILDILMPGLDGLEMLKLIKRKKSDSTVIMMSGHGTISTAVQATKLGAYDFLEKPLSREKLLLTVERAIEFKRLESENIALRSQIAEKYDMVGQSRAIKELFQQIETIGPTPSRVLISGENGTGKELVARALHQASARAGRPFVRVNCAAIPHDLIESELFGHEKGAFTGATAMRRGKFEAAHRGTIFLDEIGDMHLDTQAKVLRVLQEGELQRVGGDELIHVDVRVIAATNKELEREIKNNRFREDLFFRLNVIPFRVPALRERTQDIPLLAEHFLSGFASDYGRPPKVLDQAAQQALCAYPWPGNVRELKNLIERIFIMCPDQAIPGSVVQRFLTGASSGDTAAAAVAPLPAGDEPLKEAVAAFEKSYIQAKLLEADFHMSDAAKKLGLERSHLYKKIKSHDIAVPGKGGETT
jgi:two-component system nitrogen regulation response regulator NtrX